jgi:predicted aspartyl protease
MRDNSRRRILQLGGAILAAPVLAGPERAFALAGPASGVAPTPPPAPQAPDTSIEGDLDFQHRLTLDTLVNGQGPFSFVVDTGSDRSVISVELAAKLGLINNAAVVVQGISRSLSTPTVNLTSLQFGSVNVGNLTVPLLPRRWLGADGYLGIDAIDGRRVTFDFQHNRIAVLPSAPISRWNVARAQEVVVRVSGTSGRLKAADCSVDRVPVVAFVDSGAEYSIGNMALFNELAKSGAQFVKDVAVPVLGATGGQTFGQLTYISTIRVATMSYVHSDLIIADLPVFDVWGLKNRPALFLGMNFLQNVAAFTIDYAQKELRFKLGALEMLASLTRT